MLRLSAIQISILLHLALALSGLVVFLASKKTRVENVRIEVFEDPKLISSAKALDVAPAKQRISPPAPERRAVFGLQKNAITSNSENSLETKLGNTVAKANDNLQLNKDDADSLPIPADEFLVTQMPKIKREVRAIYPLAAKKAGITGAVVAEMLIDQNGKVREVKLISGPGNGLNEAAVEALKQFEFSPARIKDEFVSVRIRYIYRFVLENM